ncbi:MAG: twin-arginine translocase TatA/TatE family subunit [Rhodobiaceae bacterium]|nr:twin-arginine translocase TatA/TatE family subunit [Rhodobiaceae bacterium]|tara:strand:- start:605 stop:784 length:180 start_codon:yes stop_codon:yes gene_type:complete
MFPSWLQILLVVMLALIFFGRGKISEFMTDLASGIKSFRKGMSDDDNDNTAIEDNEDKE